MHHYLWVFLCSGQVSIEESILKYTEYFGNDFGGMAN